MTWEIFTSLAVYAWITGWSPGPNNVLMLSINGQFGFKKSFKLLLGTWAGFLSIMLLCVVFSVGITRFVPNIVGYLKYVGAIYIVYLAVQVLLRKPLGTDGKPPKEPTFLQGFLLQFVNVKVILYGISALSSYVLPYEKGIPALLFFAFFLTFFGATGNLVWAVVGSLCQRFYNRYYLIFNLVMAFLLLRCALKLVL